mmetsp:Transcript_3706/g.3636  ORF Transcript_3706/g.3636 Transcript_3706/m.3636 type:complete len:262 (-) Transcript_3706:105-890(-)|eukprot:CAMPEP_0170542120 /NCGR_PEP_ID=MMETSP0211-20121228/1644_1 /TAXON_ID=311385 /ORGANISM="Pseudokeronopsis sp., Strain OXSARD2" /LENGTH=261 /DNA_ID=CAMNT_0010845077 /DNA_START=123 /DNA_END=908 /DNA_ORIENTATION=-
MKTRYKCDINKSDLNFKRLKEVDLLLLGGPRLPFSAQELQDIRHYIDGGGRVLLLMSEGGEAKLQTNINAMLEQMGISVNNDCVIRKTFFKYLHPKEAFVGNGILNSELVRVAMGRPKENEGKQGGKFAKRYKDTKDELQNRDENGGLQFVYPYGASLNVRKPSFPILSSGPISYPANRPVGAFYMSPKRGKLFVMGSIMFLEDEFFEKEDNQKIQEAVFKWLLSDGEAEFERNIKEDPELSDYVHVPDVTALADRLRSCL